MVNFIECFSVNDEPESKFLYTETIKLYCIVLNVCMAFGRNESVLEACQVVFVKGTLNLPLLSVSRESNSKVLKDVCRQTNSC